MELLSIYIYVQIEDVRLRLNVDVTVASDSSPALAPIESFTDMVIFIVFISRSNRSS